VELDQAEDQQNSAPARPASVGQRERPVRQRAPVRSPEERAGRAAKAGRACVARDPCHGPPGRSDKARPSRGCGPARALTSHPSVPARGRRIAAPEQQLGRELVEPLVLETLLAQPVEVEGVVLQSGGSARLNFSDLPSAAGRSIPLRDRLSSAWISRSRLKRAALSLGSVRAHAAVREFPHAILVLGAVGVAVRSGACLPRRCPRLA